MQIRTLGWLALATVVGVGAASYVLNLPPATIPGGGGLLFPDLLARANHIATIEAEVGGERFRLQRGEDEWNVPEIHGYRADPDKVRRLIIGAAELSRVEPKTSKPENYARLGLASGGENTSDPIRFRMHDDKAQLIADLTLGESRPAKGSASDDEIYVLLGADPQVWLVQGQVPEARDALQWLEQEIIAVDRERVYEVSVQHGDGEVVTVRKLEPTDGDFTYLELPAGEEVDGQYKLNDIGRALTDLKLEGVRAAEQASAGLGEHLTVEMVTLDGLRVRMKTVVDNDAVLAQLSAEYDGSVVNEDWFKMDGAESAQSEGDELKEGLAKLRAEESVTREVAELNSRWNGWIYELPEFKVDFLEHKADTLIKPETQPEGEASTEPSG